MNEGVVIPVTREPGCEDIALPAYATPHSSGLDLRAAVTEPVTLAPGERLAVPTGLRVALPVGLEAQIRPRSGLALDHGIILPNAPGTIDADYRGEIKVIMMNLGPEPYIIRRGDRIAQMVIASYTAAQFAVAGSLDGTVRGDGGFGHTGRA